MMNNENALWKLIAEQTFTLEEQYRVLDARDKIIRLHLGKKLRSRHTKGTCPDMCPEKERLLREIQHQVSVFEKFANSDVLNHCVTVKQYIRSSADQEFPLAHELRPVSVLKFTMNYLLHFLMDLCENPETNLPEWYIFLWNRTRAIRKDIIQQDLCCPGSVELIEQCARFHIHCAARLVAEDVVVFDDKINSENLTKCLQTLKYMYHDLGLQNIQCPNEAEFRSYIILLNLNNANFLWELQQLSPEVQLSNKVKFAISVYLALDENNYVKFFKLVREADYLSACILVRYFNQVRIRAVTRILKAFARRSAITLYPIKQFTNILGFENVTEAAEFLDQLGLMLSDDCTNIVLDLNAFVLSHDLLKATRPVNLIESKRVCSVGETVYGSRPLPRFDFEQYEPYSSFDERGFLKDFRLDDYLVDNEVELGKEEGELVSDNEEVEYIDVDMSDNINKEMSPNFGNESIEGKSEVDEEIDEEDDDSENASQTTSSNEESNISNEMNVDNDKLIVENKCHLFNEKQDIIETKTTKFSKVPEFTFKLPTYSLEPKSFQFTLPKSNLTEPLKIITSPESKEIVKQIVESPGTIKRREQLDEIERQRKEDDKVLRFRKSADFMKMLYCFIKWREITCENSKKRRAVLDSVLIGPQKRAFDADFNEFEFPNFQDTLQLRKRYKYGQPLNFEIEDELVSVKLELKHLVYKILRKKYVGFFAKNSHISLSNIFWKVDISFSERDTATKDILGDIVDWGPNMCALKRDSINWTDRFVYCIKAVTKSEPKHGLVFIESVELNIDSYKRLLKSLISCYQSDLVPLTVIIRSTCTNISKDDENNVLKILNLKWLKTEKKISDFEVFFESQHQFKENLEDALKFLAEHVPNEPPIVSTNVLECLFNAVGHEFWLKIAQSCHSNRNLERIFQQPNAVIELYNEALDNISYLVLDEQIYEYADFPVEFKRFLDVNGANATVKTYHYFPDDWKEHVYIDRISRTVEALRLPEYKRKWPPISFEVLENDFKSYYNQLGSNLLSLKMSCLVRNQIANENDFRNFSWLNLICVLVAEKFKQLNSSLISDIQVMYNVHEMTFYNTHPWWFESDTITKYLKQLLPFDETEPISGFDVNLDEELERTKRARDQSREVVLEFEQFNELRLLHDDLLESARIGSLIDRKIKNIIANL